MISRHQRTAPHSDAASRNESSPAPRVSPGIAITPRLRLQIKMLLPTNLKRSLKRVLRLRHRGIHIPARDGALHPNKALRRDRIIHQKNSAPLSLHLHLYQFLRRPKLLASLGRDNANRITQKCDLVADQQMLILNNRPKFIMPCHIISAAVITATTPPRRASGTVQ